MLINPSTFFLWVDESFIQEVLAPTGLNQLTYLGSYRDGRNGIHEWLFLEVFVLLISY